MIQIPADLAKLYTSFMEQKGVETDQHRYYIKRKQAHHAVSLFYEMGHLSGRKTRNGTSYGKSAAYGRTEPEISSSHTKKVVFNQAVFSGRKIIPQTSKPGSDTNMAPGQSGADLFLSILSVFSYVAADSRAMSMETLISALPHMES